MRLFIFALFLGVVAGYTQSSKTNYVPQQQLVDEKIAESSELPIVQRTRTELPKTEATVLSTTEIAPSAAASAEFFTTTAALLQAMMSSTKPELELHKPLTSKPLKDEENHGSTPANPIPEEESVSQMPITFPSEEPSKRRVITYDQRQEGQYNIRADLENFMIVLIPPSPADGLNLLDILTKSAQRPIKNKRKQFVSAGGHNGALKYRQNLKSANTNFNLNYFPRSHNVPQQPPVTLVESVSVQRLPNEFIEGRTPYHVDISASDDEQSRLLPNRQVDVLPPPFPLAYQHLIKPFHLEAEPSVIQTLPPAEIGQNSAQSSGNFLDSYNQLLASSLNAQSNDGVPGESSLNSPGYYRMSRNIRNDNYLETNRLAPSSSQNRGGDLPMYRADMSFGASSLYPPLDVPRFMGRLERLKTARRDGDAQQLEEVMFVPAIKEDPEINAGFIDTEAKSLLSDGNLGLMERCAPGHRRDSYGICREIEGY